MYSIHTLCDTQYIRGWGKNKKKKQHKTHPFSHCILYTIEVKILCYAKKENLFLSSIQFSERMERSLLSDLCVRCRKVTKKEQLKVRLRSYLVGYSVAVPNIIYIYVCIYIYISHVGEWGVCTLSIVSQSMSKCKCNYVKEPKENK